MALYDIYVFSSECRKEHPMDVVFHIDYDPLMYLRQSWNLDL
jgi:hypothetical protein